MLKLVENVARLEEAAHELRSLFDNRSRSRVAAIEATCEELSRHLTSWHGRLWAELEEDLAGWEGGCPPSFIRLAGQSHLEKPFNRLLAWMVNPEGNHGWGFGFLRLLAEKVGLPEMVADIADECRGGLDIRAETSLDGDDSRRMPDLAIRTEHAALLLENKVWAPQSGDDQYVSYLALFRTWAGGRERRAVLCAREARDVPDDWTHFLPHRELANLLTCLADENLDLPIWSRICAALCAETLRDRDLVNTLRSAQELRRSRPGDHPASFLDQISALRKLLPLPRPITPWTKQA
jgi:hypothetical protein